MTRWIHEVAKSETARPGDPTEFGVDTGEYSSIALILPASHDSKGRVRNPTQISRESANSSATTMSGFCRISSVVRCCVMLYGVMI